METGFFTGRTRKDQTFQEAVHHLERTEVGYNSTLSKLLEQNLVSDIFQWCFILEAFIKTFIKTVS